MIRIRQDGALRFPSLDELAACKPMGFSFCRMHEDLEPSLATWLPGVL
jgi:hypothetical protein